MLGEPESPGPRHAAVEVPDVTASPGCVDGDAVSRLVAVALGKILDPHIGVRLAEWCTYAADVASVQVFGGWSSPQGDAWRDHPVSRVVQM
jgi:hypothetical protein